jgi:hypothetical protein
MRTGVAAVLGICLLAQPALARPARAPAVPTTPSATAARLADWVIATGDNNGMPYVVVDKATAVVSVFDATGRPLGSAPALIGQAVGDESAPGIGDRPMSQIRPEERTTPAGRFIAAYGPAEGAGETFWVDYATAISLHPVATGNPKERRIQRLRSASPADNRITYGCINVSADFYRSVVHKTFADARGVVYILPDTIAVQELFPRFAAQELAAADDGGG